MLRETLLLALHLLRDVALTALLVCGGYLTFLCVDKGIGGDLFAIRCKGSRVELAELRTREVEAAAGSFVNERRACPTAVDDLIEARFLSRDQLKDPWGHRLLFGCVNEGGYYATFTRSAGRDGDFGTTDDISAASLFDGRPPE